MNNLLLLSVLLFSILLSNAQWQTVMQNIGNGVTARTDIEIAPNGTICLAYLLYSSRDYHVKKYTTSTSTRGHVPFANI